MFSFFGAAEIKDGEEEIEEGGSNDAPETGASTSKPAAAAAGFGFDIWGVASAVSNSVKATAGGIVNSVKTTDWKAELAAFSREVESDTHALKVKTSEMVEHLPEVLEHLPAQAHQVSAGLQQGLQAGGLPGMAGNASFEEVGGSLTRFGQSLLVGTKELLEQVREAVETEISSASKEQKRAVRGARAAKAGGSVSSLSGSKLGAGAGKYSRFEAEVSAMQRDSSTYCDEPEDRAEYDAWRAAVSVRDRLPDIERIVSGNAFMAELQARIVPIIVDYDDFWTRYFYRYHKLQQKEEARQQLAARAKSLSKEEDEDLGWGDDADDDAQTAAAAAAAAIPAGAPAGGAAAAGGSVSTPPIASLAAAVTLAAASAPAGSAPLSPSRLASFPPLNGAAVPTLAPVDEAALLGEPQAYRTAPSAASAPVSPNPLLASHSGPPPAPSALAAAAARTSSRSPPPLHGYGYSDGGSGGAFAGSHGGSSSAPEVLDVDHHDSVTAETASDTGSGRGEWCVVSGSGGGAAAVGGEHLHALGRLGLSPPVAGASAPALSTPALAAALVADLPASVGAAVARVSLNGGDASPAAPLASPPPPAAPGVAAPLAAAAAGERPPRPVRRDDAEEEEDLDWGTWD